MISLSPYARKLTQRAEGIWPNMGLSLEKQDAFEHDGGYCSLMFYFHNISPAQAELLVSQMGKAFRRANVYWKEDEEAGIVVRVEIPPM